MRPSSSTTYPAAIPSLSSPLSNATRSWNGVAAVRSIVSSSGANCSGFCGGGSVVPGTGELPPSAPSPMRNATRFSSGDSAKSNTANCWLVPWLIGVGVVGSAIVRTISCVAWNPASAR